MKRVKVIVLVLLAASSILVLYTLHSNLINTVKIHKSGLEELVVIRQEQLTTHHKSHQYDTDYTSKKAKFDGLYKDQIEQISETKVFNSKREKINSLLLSTTAAPVEKSTKLHFHILNASHAHKVDPKCNIVKLYPERNGKQAQICAYSRKEDKWISGTLEDAGKWESATMSAMEKLYQQDPSLGFIDIGANIGVFTVLAALWGRKVLAVEANPNNAYRLINSVRRNRMAGLVTVINNAVSDNYDTVQMVVDNTNRGGSIVISDKAGLRSRAGIPPGQEEFVQNVSSIHMNDLTNLITFNKSILKIDIEGYESVAFTKSSQLFEKAGICYIFMEWHWLREEGGAAYVYDMLSGLGFRPYVDAGFQERIHEMKDIRDMNVYWKKDKC